MKLHTLAAISEGGICYANPYLGKHGKKLWFICPNCHNVFSVRNGHSQNVYLCPRCSTKVKATTRAREQPSLLEFRSIDTVEIGYNAFAYAVETCKGAERIFLSVFDPGIRQELENQVNNAKLLIRELSKKDQDIIFIEIPQGIETLRLRRLGYDNFSKIFSYCQLATYLVLAEEIRKVPSHKIRKLLTLALSNSVRSCSMLASYYQPHAKVNPAFVIKSFWMPKNLVELNVLAHDLRDLLRYIGRGNFISALCKIVRALRWIKKPRIKIDKDTKNGKLYLAVKPRGKFYIFNLAIQELQNFSIIPGIPKNFDLVITDPPYIDTQYYSELSLAFMYAQNLVFRRYDTKYFILQYQRTKDLEIAPSRYSENKYEDYMKHMNTIFQKLESLLKGDGYLTFTFHYPRIEGWYALYKSIVTTNLIPINFYVIPGEASGRLGRSSLLVDILLVFKKGGKIFREESLITTLQLIPRLLQNNIIRKFFGKGSRLRSTLLNFACAYTLMKNLMKRIPRDKFKKEVKEIMNKLEHVI